MAPHDLRRQFRRRTMSDQQKRRDASLRRQAKNRSEAQEKARSLASLILPSPDEPNSPPQEAEMELVLDLDDRVAETEERTTTCDIYHVPRPSELRRQTRQSFAKQLMLPEWIIDVPNNLSTEWYVLARPAGKRCFVMSCDGTTISKTRNGAILHRFSSLLPSGSKTSRSSRQSYCILDCIFHEPDQTYYVLDLVCWAGTSYYYCTADFRFSWLKCKLDEAAFDTPSTNHRYRFVPVPFYNCDRAGLQAAYSGVVPYVKDGLIFYYKNARYEGGNTPLALVWKDQNCSPYPIDTDHDGDVPVQQLMVLELLTDGKVVTFDDPPVVIGSLGQGFIRKRRLQPGDLLRFVIGNGGLSFMNGRLANADIQYQGKAHRARVSADSYSKIIFQFIARRSPLRIEDLLASIAEHEMQMQMEMEMDNLALAP